VIAQMANRIDQAARVQRWVHSCEEDTDHEMVFRQDSFAAAPARSGEWKLDEANRLLSKSLGETTSTLQVLQVEPDKVVARKPSVPRRLAAGSPVHQAVIEQIAEKIEQAPVARHWVHSREEDTDREMVFRQGSFAVASVRGGEWKLDEANWLLMKSLGETTSTLQVLRVEPDKVVERKP
jgi:hypothetical protein